MRECWCWVEWGWDRDMLLCRRFVGACSDWMACFKLEEWRKYYKIVQTVISPQFRLIFNFKNRNFQLNSQWHHPNPSKFHQWRHCPLNVSLTLFLYWFLFLYQVLVWLTKIGLTCDEVWKMIYNFHSSNCLRDN